jgi:hypothetical protein
MAITLQVLLRLRANEQQAFFAYPSFLGTSLLFGALQAQARPGFHGTCL